MKINGKKLITTGVAVLLSATLCSIPCLAQDADDDSDGFGSNFDSLFEDTDSGSNALQINGEGKLSVKATLNDDTLDAIGDTDDDSDTVEATPSLKLNLSYKGASSELDGTIRLDSDRLTDHPEDVLEELTYRAFMGDFVLEAGKMKVVWGRGDKLHVLDLFNANDYSEFIIPDYINRRLAEPMARLAWNIPNGMRVEAVWTPFMTPDRIPTEGVWAPASAKALVTAGTSYVSYLASSAYGEAYASTYETAYTQAYTTAYKAAETAALTAGYDATAAATMADVKAKEAIAEPTVAAQISGAASGAALLAAEAVSSQYSSANDLLPDTHTLDYGQYGLRLTGTFSGVDLGAEYYLGHYKTPSAQVTYGTNALGDSAVTGLDLAYDQLQVFGVDAATTLSILNLRGEAAYYLTKDVDGDDSAVHNNSIQWVAGFDVNLPISNLNLNIQNIGSYILNNDDIEKTDVDWNDSEKWTNNKIVFDLSDSWNHEKIKPDIAVMWGIERQDLLIMPKLTCTLRDDFTVAVSGGIFICDDDGEFAAYKDNDFVKLTATYSF